MNVNKYKKDLKLFFFIKNIEIKYVLLKIWLNTQ
jgi:hypothetical protein